MGIHLKKYGFSLLTPPKCGSTSLKHLAFEIENGRPFQKMVHNGKTLFVHRLYPTGTFEVEQARMVNGQLFAMVRNPVDRIVSCHSNRVMALGELDAIDLSEADRDAGLMPRPDLANFVRNLEAYGRKSRQIWHHSRGLSHFLGTDAARYTEIFDLAHLDRLVARLGALVGADMPALKHLQTGGHRYKPTVLPDDVRDMIETKFAEDFDIFGAFFATQTAAL